MAYKVNRAAILDALHSALEPLSFVDAFWEGGAVAWDRIDEWSDTDLYVVIEDGAADRTFDVVEEALRGLSPIAQTFVMKWPPDSGMAQRFYRLEGASPFLLVDLAVMNRSRPDKDLQPEMHGSVAVRFDKTGATKAEPFDEAAFEKTKQERIERLRAFVEMFHIFVEKELNRAHPIEAVDEYHQLVLKPLLEMLKLKHWPHHHRFGVRYVYDELPDDVIRRYEPLVFVSDVEDLREKSAKALAWFRELAAEMG